MPNIFRKSEPLFGATLDAAILSTPPVRPALVEGLILEKSVTMVAAEPGSGKSTLLLTMVSQTSAALPVFGTQACSRPLKSYVFCPERDATELRERLHTMRHFIPFDTNNICIDDGMVGIVDISNPTCVSEIKAGIRKAFPGGFDLFFVEGMYGMTRLPLADEKTANLFYRFNADMIREFHSSIWYSNHTRKKQFYKGEEQEAQSFGSQFLMANVTGAYIFERLAAKNTSRIYQKKDTVSGLVDELQFQFDAERFVLEAQGGGAAKERLRQYLNATLNNGCTFTYADAAAVTHLSRSQCMNLLTGQVSLGIIENGSPRGKKALYKVLRQS